jgi:hypothetical protein
MDNTVFYPIEHILPDPSGHGLIVGKNGSLTYMVRLSSPEVYSLSEEDIHRRHNIYRQAFSYMPDNSSVHKQDVFLKSVYKPSGINLSYLAKADYDHFSGREYIEHKCMIGFTLAGINSLSAAYTKNIFSFKEYLHKEDADRLGKFLSAVEYAVNNLSSLKNTRINFLSVDEMKEYLFFSANFYDTSDIKDIHFAEEISAGKVKAKIYAIADDEYLPEEIGVAEKDYTVSTDKSELYMSIAEPFGGIHLNHSHTYNQIYYFYSDKLLKERMRKNLDDHIVNRGWDKMNMPAKIERLKGLVQDINHENETLCFAHFSFMLWNDDSALLELAESDFNKQMNLSNIKYYVPSYGNLANIYGGSIIGCTSSLGLQYMFMTSLSLATAFLVHYSTFKNDEDGIWFNDRLTQKPLRKDIWDARNKRIKARNSIVIAPTGSGKSFTVNNIIQQLLDQSFTIVAVEFGNSFKQLCYLYPDNSIHIEYDSSQPLGINPFNLEGRTLTADKVETLVTLCLRFWRKPDVDANQTVALRKFLSHYYKEIKTGHSFQTFYSYMKENFKTLCKAYEIEPDYFDIQSFLHVCSEFMPGGAYENLCIDTGVASNLDDKQFIHFELTKVKSDPFVASVVMSLLFDVINYKILSDPSKKGYIVFDEYAETAQMKSQTALDVDIHQTVAFFYQKIRKENGAVMTIIQSPVQLPDNEYTKGIIANTQLLYVLEGTQVVYESIIDTFKIKNPAHISQMKSIQNNYSCTRPHSECWIRFGEDYALTVRIEASRTKYLAFQTQGEIRAKLDSLYKSNGNDMKKAIEYYKSNN